MQALTLTLSKEKWGLFNRVPVLLHKQDQGEEALTPSARVLCEKIYSLSKAKKGEKVCRMTYDQAVEEFGRSRSTIAEAFKQLKTKDMIKKESRDQDGTAYVYNGETPGAEYYITPVYLYTAIINTPFGRRKMRESEIRVLSFLMTKCALPENGGKPYGGGVYWTSHKKLARKLGLAPSTVKRAIWFLFKAKLIYRPKRNKGFNGEHVSGYEVDSCVYIYRKYVKKAKTPLEEQAKREAYYKDMREAAERRADRYMSIARETKGFLPLWKNFRQKDIEIARAEAFEPSKVSSLKREKRTAQASLRAFLREIGLELEDVIVQYHCKECQDTGQRPNGGACNCYPGGEL